VVCSKTREQLGRPPVRRLLVVNSAPPRGRTLACIRDALRTSAPFAPVVIGNRISFAIAIVGGESVLTTEPSGPAAEELRALWSVITTPAEMKVETHVH
jgi:hypothetical protein